MRWTAVLLTVFTLIIGSDGKECKNGGFALDDGTCNCPTLFNDGDDCSQKQCLNMGYLDDKDNCICPPGYNGLACDAVSAYRPSPGAFPTKKSFNLVVANFLTDNYGKNALDVVKNLLNDTDGLQLDQFDEFHLKEIRVSSAATAWSNIKLNGGTVDDFNFDANSGKQDFTNVDDFFTYMRSSDSLVYQRTQTYQCYRIPGFYKKLLGFLQDNRLARTTVTIFTQHPALNEEEDKQKLIYFANAFQIKINVLWGYDKTFLRCDYTSADIVTFWNFARDTHGSVIGVGPSRAEMGNLEVAQLPIQTLLSLHGDYELVQQEAYDSCTHVTFNLTGDFGTHDYILVFRTNAPMNEISVQLADSQLTSFLSGPFKSKTNSDSIMYQVSQLPTVPSIPLLQFTINATTDTSDKCVLRAYIRNINSNNLRAFTSFVESPTQDSSVVIPIVGNPYYLTAHVEAGGKTPLTISTVTINSRNEVHTSEEMSLATTKRDSTFEFITTETYDIFNQGVSTGTPYYWTEIVMTDVNGHQYRRVVPSLNVHHSINTKTNPDGAPDKEDEDVEGSGDGEDTTTNAPTTNPPTTTTTVPPTTIAPEECLATLTAETSLALGYSNSIVDDLRNSLVIQIKDTSFNNYALVMWDRVINDKDTAQKWGYSDTAGQAATASYNTYTKNTTLSKKELDETDVIQQITKLVDDGKMVENSLIVLLVADEPNKNSFDTFKTTDHYKKIITQGYRFMFVAAIDSIPDDRQMGRGPNFFSLLAGTTQGHYILLSQDDHTGDSDSTATFRIYQDLFNQIGNRPLVHSFDIAQSSPTSPSQIILDGVQSDIELYVTVSFDAVSGTSTVPTCFTFITHQSESGLSVPLNLTAYGKSNFFSGSVTLPAGHNYTIDPVYFCTPDVDMHIRYWGKESIVSSVKFNDLTKDEPLELGPNQNDGMAARVAVQTTGAETIDVFVTYCDGTTSTLYGRAQTSPLKPSTDCQNAYFYPYFCTPNTPTQCPQGYEGLHYAKFRVNGNANTILFTRPFLCDSTTPTTPSPDCSSKDGNGNVFCSAKDSPDGPYYRGPTGQLYDCSGNGDLVYAKRTVQDPSSKLSDYRCVCSEGFTSDSCQSGQCGSAKNQAPGTLDTNYRSFSVVVGQSVSYNGPVSNYILQNEVKNLLPTAAIPGVWLYQLHIQYTTGEIFPLYIGPSWDEFMGAVNNNQLDLSPLTAPDIPVLNLEDSYRTIIAPLGQHLRGLALFYYHSDGADDAVFRVNGDDDNSTTIEAFMTLTQRYKQQVLLLTRVETMGVALEDGEILVSKADQPLMQVVRSTGGIWIESNDTTVTISDENGFKEFRETVMSVLVSGTPISLNLHEQVLKGGQVHFQVEDGAANSVLVLASDEKNSGRLWEGECDTTQANPQLQPLPYAYVPLKPGQAYCFKTNNRVAVLSVFTSGGISPVTQFVRKWNDDTPTAFATNTTSIGPSLAVSIAGDWTNDDPSSRKAHREQCTFADATYSMDKLQTIGYSAFKFDVGSQSGNKGTKYIPFSTTATIDCQNGGTFNPPEGSCDCPDGYSGADCSHLQCENGVQNVWANACNCYQQGSPLCNSDIPV